MVYSVKGKEDTMDKDDNWGVIDMHFCNATPSDTDIFLWLHKNGNKKWYHQVGKEQPIVVKECPYCHQTLKPSKLCESLYG